MIELIMSVFLVYANTYVSEQAVDHGYGYGCKDAPSRVQDGE